MKLEKLNDNQIRCTLSKSDLDKRKLRLSELAYGSAKARALFRDMIQQASIELGFEAENIPLMIEAIPISNDCLVLVMTKVEDPDELDTRFSRFSSPIDDEMAILDDETDFFDPSPLSEDSLAEEESSFASEEEALSFSSSADEKEEEQSIDEAMDLIAPFTQAIAQAKKEVLRKKQEAVKKNSNLQVYIFPALDIVIRLSSFLAPFYPGESHLYKDMTTGNYHLALLRQDCDKELFQRACTIAADYGTAIRSSYSTLSYYEEHFQTIFSAHALSVLSELNH